ncbi:hypothetical protein AAF712_016361 [Marasmius tenuissimus]|uniref:Uncharacterized protein n=1 Tax=Marasmius tenuissimus TaxID=585030 RepID=A0ABR2Z5X4_9AGAR
MDGNNSLKLVDPAVKSGKARLDTRELRDPRWLEAEQVDKMKDEVVNAQRLGSSRGKKKQEMPTNSNNPGSSPATSSVAAHLSFNSECSHLPILNSHEGVAWLNVAEQADKATQAEDGPATSAAETEELLKGLDMMKYLLAIVKQLLEDFGRELRIGYDIMCVFYTTMVCSQKLGHKVVSYAVQGVVPAFHGHAHNWKCQTCWHPQYLTGVGLTDFKDCNFLYKNYRQAQDQIERDGPEFAAVAQALNLMAGEYPELKQRVDYLELFEKVNWAKGEPNKAHLKYKVLNSRTDLSTIQVNKIKARNISMFKCYERLAEELEDYEMDHGILRWVIRSPEHRQAQDGLKERTYQRALEELEKLVVQRLFELTKLNMSGVFIEMASVANFNLLKNTHIDIGNLIWTKPEYREAMRLHFGLLRACEEKVRCDVEITQLIMYMIDEHADYQLAIQRLQGEDPNLVAELRRQAQYWEAVHSRIAERLALTS